MAELVGGDDGLFDHGMEKGGKPVLHVLAFNVRCLGRLQENADVFQRHAGSGEDRKSQRFWNAEESQEQVLRTDVRALHGLGFLLRDLQGELGVGSESVERVHTNGGETSTH